MSSGIPDLVSPVSFSTKIEDYSKKVDVHGRMQVCQYIQKHEVVGR